MSDLSELKPSRREVASAAAPEADARAVYAALSREAPDASEREAARDYLECQLDVAATLTLDLPADPGQLENWSARHTESVGLAYRAYLAERRAGAARRYFGNKSHALYFLHSAAPTKLADGAWLYGLLPRWQDPDYRPLIRTYLEELGDGLPAKNHVALYRDLLARHDCEDRPAPDERHFVQGAIQLALAHHAERFLPEIVGYNLGYEQLPLHLLITAYELEELGIDPYYFTLHVTIDNAATGHARKAVRALEALRARSGDPERFDRRVAAGYRLNELGANTPSMIAAFDLEAELAKVLVRKAEIGRHMHSGYCRIDGRSVNDWLSDPAAVPRFLQALEAQGWIRRGEPVENSRFWRLIEGERAEMFGVFDGYERQLLRDWIAGPPARQPAYRAQRRLSGEAARPIGRDPRGLFRERREDGIGADPELRRFEERLAALPDKPTLMAALIEAMSPASHHSAKGLMATRLFSRLLG